MHEKAMNESKGDIQISFGYQCAYQERDPYEVPKGIDIPSSIFGRRNNSSFSCLSGAALSANATLANTNICNGLIGAEILPTLDSPNSFRRIPSSPSFSKLDLLSSSLHSNVSNLSCSPSTPTELQDYDSFSPKSTSTPKTDGFLNTTEVEVAGGAAGEDRVQAVCSEENGWLFCGIYDGFNGRDAADFLAGTLYERIGYHLNLLDMELEQELLKTSKLSSANTNVHHLSERHQFSNTGRSALVDVEMYSYADSVESSALEAEKSGGSYKERVLSSLQNALTQAENDFLHMVKQEMDDCPDLVSVGCCVLFAFLLGKNLYMLNIGDSRALLATCAESIDTNAKDGLIALQLSDIHSVDNEDERAQLLQDHPDDPSVIYGGKVKGKLKVTRALGVGYLKKQRMNDALMGILRVRNLASPPYISVQPSLKVHEISNSDLFVVLGSDGLFDFFTNEEVVKLVHFYISSYPSGDPAKYLVEQLLIRAANCAGFTIEQLLSIPVGRRRKYHDDVTVMVIILGMNKRTLKASTRM